MEIQETLLYTPDHLWVRVEGNLAVIGITDYAQLEMGMILYVELPVLYADVNAKEVIGSIETVDDVIDIRAPLTGTITAINSLLEREAFKINASPYGHGWMFKMEMADSAELECLLPYTYIISTGNN